MLKFNFLLQSVGIEAQGVRLLRHKHGPEYQRLVYQDAITGHPRFEQYQSGQASPQVIAMIKSSFAIASFVVGPGGHTVFVGLWRLNGTRDTYLPDPYYTTPMPARGGDVVFDLEPMQELSEYRGRIVVDWGAGQRAWVQYADRRDKTITELRRVAEEPAFPGFSRFSCGLHEVDSIPKTWQSPLLFSRGVYLLVHRENGEQYVGSATGSDGFLGRWRAYADGHGGNVGLKELAHGAEQYAVHILETVGSNASIEDVFAIESHWKDKLGSRAHGLNRN